MGQCIVVSGPPCAGKSSVAGRIADRYGWPLLAKDGYKERVFRHLGGRDRAWSRRVSLLAWELLLAEATSLLAHDVDCILEGNWRELQARALVDVATEHGARLTEVLCVAPPDVLLARYRARASDGTRHPGHVDLEALAEIERDLSAAPHAVLPPGSGLLRSETSEGIDWPELARRLDALLGRS